MTESTQSAAERIADYDLVSPLGDVEHGTLWQALPPGRLSHPDPYVVIKVLDQPGTADDLESMRQELSLHGTAASAHLVPMIEAGRQGETLFYSFGFVREGGLAKGVADLDRAQRLLVIADVARAVHALHEVGLAHGDIHPGTIDVAAYRGLVSDLGLTQVLRPGQTVTGVGENLNLSYRAPELLNGGSPSRASDVFAIGGVLHQVLAGRSVFPALDSLDLVGSLRFMLAPMPDIDPTLSPAEADVVRSCLCADPRDRPGKAATVAAQLDQLVVECGGSL